MGSSVFQIRTITRPYLRITYTGPRLNIKTVFRGVGIPIAKIKRP